MNRLLRSALLGSAAGAAGTTALNAVTYLDMAVRGRSASSTPEDTVERVSETLHVPVPGSGEVRTHRVAGLGPLTGLLAGVGTGALLGACRAAGWRPRFGAATTAATVGALVGTNGPMTVLGVSDPRTWPAFVLDRRRAAPSGLRRGHRRPCWTGSTPDRPDWP